MTKKQLLMRKLVIERHIVESTTARRKAYWKARMDELEWTAMVEGVELG